VQAGPDTYVKLKKKNIRPFYHNFIPINFSYKIHNYFLYIYIYIYIYEINNP
jgi:hypothetical protein